MSFQLYRAAIAHLPRIVVGVPQTLHVATDGDDGTGDGSLGAPFLTPAAAQAVANPGDTIVFRPGTYDPFEVTINGAAGRPITFSTLPGEEQQAIIKGDLDHHNSVPGGDGNYTPNNNATRDGVRIVAKNYIHVKNLHIRDCWRCGIFCLGGSAGTTYGNHEFRDNLIHTIGTSAIRFEGQNSDTVLPRSEDGSPRNANAVIAENEVYNGNIPNDNIVAPDTEIISVAAGCENVDTIGNTVGNAAIQSTGYGIDYKAGVRGGTISGNRVFNMTKYGIYLDAGRRWVSGITVKDNKVYDVEIGFVMAREAAPAGGTYADGVTALGAADFVQELSDIDAFNNEFSNIDKSAIYLQAHPRDGEHGSISNIRIRFNSVWNARRVSGSDLNLETWDNLGTSISNVDFIGHAVWNTEGNVTFAQAFPVPAWMNYDDNHTGSNPGFFNDTITPADMTLTIGSPAIGTVAASYAASPFNLDINGVSRADPANAGSTAGSVAAFAITLASDGTLEIDNNDGRDFVVDDADDDYDGTYSVTNAALANGPVALKAPVLAGDGTPVAGETLTIVPALFAYEGDDGAVTVAYTTTGTNTVDVTDPDNPTLLVAVADEGSTITVTATATQGVNDTDSVSNGVAIPATAANLTVAAVDIQDETTSTATPSFTIDESAYGNSDTMFYAYGGDDTPTVFTVGGVDVLPNEVHINTSGGGDRRIRIYSRTLSGAGSASTAVNITVPNPVTNHILQVAGAKNAVVGDSSADGAAGAQTGSGAQITATVTPVGANNAILAFALGRDGGFGAGKAWTGATQLSDFTGTNMGGAIALAEDVPVAAYDVSFDVDPAGGASDDQAVVATIALTEAP